MSLAATILQVALLVAAPDPDPVRAAANEAAVLVREARYDEAMQRLDRAEAEAGSKPVFVYMRGVVEEERGNCVSAIEYYDQFLALEVPEVDAAEARRRRTKCERMLPPPPIPEPATVEPPEPPPPEPPPRPWYADPAGVSLTVVGGAGLVAGATLYVLARSNERAAESAAVLETYDESGTRAERLSRAGIVTLSVAGAVIVGAVVRYAIVRRRGKKARSRGRAHANYFGTISRLR